MIAMALSLEPDLLIADEPTSALDVTLEAQIIALLRSVEVERGITVLLVTHDLGIVSEICSRVVVMYAGQVVEEGPLSDVLERPQHPYTEALIAATPSRSRRGSRLASIPGRVPSLTSDLRGCRFAGRCSYVREACRDDEPRLRESADGVGVRCHMRDPDSKYHDDRVASA